MEAHVQELEALGVARPKSMPMYYRISPDRLTTAPAISVTGEHSSGEVEFVLFAAGGKLYVGAGSDHTDRKLEAYGIIVGIVTACESRLSSDLLRLVHVSPQDPVIVYGIDAYPEFAEPFIRDSGMVNTETLESVCSDLGKRMLAEHPEMGSILLECADLPPYAHAFQRATGLPVFDFATMITYLVSGNRRVPYAGLY